jgi:lysyl-tRNA synthetase class 1
VARTWFATIYQILLGQDQGPRFGSFIALYGVAETRALIAKALSGELAQEHEVFLKQGARGGLSQQRRSAIAAPT